ncbi:unnamed protein product [Cyclocybe aegerita]|uniref:Uncharacterized protein n=1 Tax=Cyclocybe aegerita TaxID=1973307 RepID=A0A8S0X1U8_CYCAE|nr:unnamed protein product [Cyclocybe aegerita]
MSVTYCLQLFQVAPRMLSCDLSHVRDTQQFPSPSKHIVPQLLPVLKINTDGLEISEALVGALSLLALKVLVYGNEQTESLRFLLQRSSSPLTKLPMIDNDELATTDLTLISTTALSEDGKPTFLPHLQSLCLSGEDEFAWEVIPRVFPLPPASDECRQRPLKFLGIEISEWCTVLMEEQVLAKIEALVNVGIDISITEDLAQRVKVMENANEDENGDFDSE